MKQHIKYFFQALFYFLVALGFIITSVYISQLVRLYPELKEIKKDCIVFQRFVMQSETGEFEDLEFYDYTIRDDCGRRVASFIRKAME